MGFLYEAVVRAKLAIQANCKYYKAYWKIIDNRWEKQLHHDLHAAGYFFNPQYRYNENEDRSLTDEIRVGLKNVIEKLAANEDDACEAINQIDIYNEAFGSFGTPTARRAIMKSFPAEWWLNYGESAPILRKIAMKVLSQTTTSSNCERNWSTFSFIHTKVRNRLTMQKLNKLVYIHYNIKLRNRQRRRREFEDQTDYFCPINLNYIFSENDDVLAQWIEEVEEPVLDHDEQIGDMVQELTGERPEPMRAAERLREINLTHQRRHGVNPQEMRDEVDDDEDTSLSSTSSSSDVPHDSDGDGGGDGCEIPPHMMETVEHFPSSGNIDPTRGYQRIIPPTESSHAGASGSGYGRGEGTSGGDVGHQQVMYGDYYVLHPHQQLELPHEFYRQYHDYPQSSQSTNDSASLYEAILVPQPHPQAQQLYGHYGSGGYVTQQFGAFYPSRNNDDDDDNIEPGRHSFWH
ncbi:hypothetical protein CKAN_00144800 [Cinnamomum micranthum f. kanehirae]|uniref:HAT C-terminal dimerisation domain-containing protein n=1 Tax=Cinnamomum micranthum f. kanehirae TaxID=337451 RepID=A0A443N3V9_9MAGN|nr:hypothetical protein CKAN_00144800 [Cinnamomum micranthum f. kanehirae]